MVHIDDTTTICAKCRIRKSHSEFRRRRAGSEQRHSTCRPCYNQEMREYRASRKQTRLEKTIRSLGRQRRRDHSITTALVRDALKRFGGVSGFGREWRRVYDSAQEAGNHMLAFSCVQALVNLRTAAEATEPDYDEMDELITEDLERRVVYGALETNPGIVEFYAKSWGWTEPPAPGSPPLRQR